MEKELVNMISFSGGRTSAYMTIKLLETGDYTEDNTIIIFANTGKEKEQTLLFVKQIEEYIGREIIWVEYFPDTKFKVVNYETASRKGEPFELMLKKKKYLPNVAQRFCTTELKIRVIKNYLKSIGVKKFNNIIGIRYDEPRRYNKVKNYKTAWTDKYPLVDMKISIEDINKFFLTMPFDLQLKHYQGNCDLCFLKGIKKRLFILKEDPTIAEWWINEEKKRGATFNKDWSVEMLLKKANSQLNELKFTEADSDFSCYCGD